MKTVILLSGKMQSGKNQFAVFLKEQYLANAKVVVDEMFAKGVKDGCKEDFHDLAVILNSIADKVGNPDIEKMLRISEDNWYENKTPITRCLLQTYGTNIMRARVDPDWWVLQLKERVSKSVADVILVSDVRFPNEIEVVRPSTDDNYKLVVVRINRTIDRVGDEHEHESEKALDTYTNFDFSIDNDGSLEDLKQKAGELILKIETA